MKKTSVLIALLAVISIGFITSCASLPETGNQSYYSTEEYKNDYALGNTDGYSVGYAGNPAKLNPNASTAYVNGYTEGHKKGLEQRKLDFPAQGQGGFNNASNTSAWQDTKYSADRDRSIMLYKTVLKALQVGVNVIDYNGHKVVALNLAKDTLIDDGRMYLSIINESGKKAVVVEAPSQPGNSVAYLIDGLKGFEVANLYTNGDARAKFVPVVYKGTTSFLTGNSAPANGFYDGFSSDMIYNINDLLPFSDKWSNQDMSTFVGNGFKKLGSWIGIGK